MTDLDKFRSDSDRIVTRSASPGGIGTPKAATELTRLFLSYTRDYGELGQNLASYWTRRYAPDLADPAKAADAADWLGSVLALLSGSFAPDMDFPDEDWDEIRAEISASAEDLDMDFITSIMTIIVERGKV